MESLESTETSRCGVIDLFPHPPGPLQTCRPTVTLTAAWGGGGVHPGAGAGSLCNPPRLCKSWVAFNSAPSDIHRSCRLRACAVGRCRAESLPPLIPPTLRDALPSPSHFSDEKAEAQGSWAACPRPYVRLGSARPCLPRGGISRAPQLFICPSPANAQTETGGCTERGPPTA